MCGRVAQTADAVNVAVTKFPTLPRCEKLTVHSESMSNDNFNISPGMECDVMLKNENGNLYVERKKWGLVTKTGNVKKPLYTDRRDLIKMCFDSLCFNARSDTLYSKPTFSKLAHRGRTCIIAVDGYFEWKSHPIPKMNKKKQPYFVYRKQVDQHVDKRQPKREPLLIAGMWTNVQTGIPDDPELGTFTMLTTDASEQIRWLHHRMPICIWDINLAEKWLTQPTEGLKKELDDAARCNINRFDWHKVTPKMSKLTFRSQEAIVEMKETTQSVKHFFAGAGSLVKKTGKNSSEHPSASNNSMRKKNSMISEKQNSISSIYAATDTPKQSGLTPTNDGECQPNLSTACFSPKKNQSYTKSKLKRSTAPNQKGQVSIECFFDKKRRKIRHS